MKIFNIIVSIITACSIGFTSPMEPNPNNSITQNRPFNTQPPQKPLPGLPPVQSPVEFSANNSTTQNKQSNSLPPQRALPTTPSMQNPIVPIPTRPIIHNKQPKSLPPQKALPTTPSLQNSTDFLQPQKIDQKEPKLQKQKKKKVPVQKTSQETKHTTTINKEQRTEKSSQSISAPKQFTTNNLIMLLDPEKTEILNGTARLLVQDALVGLYEQAAPIIMSSNILEIITTLRDIIGDNNLQMLRYSNQPALFAQTLLTSYNLYENPLHLMILSLIEFNNKNFIFYFHISEDLVLIIPQQYITENIEDASNLNFQNQAKKCGFNTAVIVPTTDLNSKNVLRQLEIQQGNFKHKDHFIENLTSLFIPQKEHGQLITLTENTPWNIYLGGHGGTFYQSIGSIREQLKINKKNLIMLEEALQNNKKRHETKEYITATKTKIKKYEKTLQGKSDWPDSQLVMGEANITGLKMDDFSSLMKFFNQKLHMYFLHYTSCFDGGYKQTFVNETLSALNVDFIVSTQGLDERESNGINLELQFSSQKPYISVSKRPFSSFFKLLKIFIDKPEDFVKAKKYKKEPFSYVLSAIVPDMNPHNQPFIRFPGAGIFGALSLGKNTKNITHALIKAHEIENKPIDLSDTNINIVTITPSRINIPINFNNNINCAIISPTPSNINAAHAAIHIFKEINFNGSLQSLIFNFISFNARIHTQTFIIKQLNSSNGTIHNLIIQIKNIPGQTIRSRIAIAFELNENMYQCITEINNFEDPYLAYSINSLGFMITTDLNTIANILLTPQEVAKLKKPISLETIANFIDAKIDIQQPSLKDTAVKKELTEFVKEMPKK